MSLEWDPQRRCSPQGVFLNREARVDVGRPWFTVAMAPVTSGRRVEVTPGACWREAGPGPLPHVSFSGARSCHFGSRILSTEHRAQLQLGLH